MNYMTPALRPRTLVLFLGDIVFFTLSLWISLYLRVFTAPSLELFEAHLVPFSLLFIAWVLVFFIAGLYESRSIILERRTISVSLLMAQVINMVIAALFFFFVPIFGIAPKTLLVIYLAVSFILVLIWRVALFPRFGLQKTENAIMVGNGQEIKELAEAMNRAPRAPVHIAEFVGADTPELSAAIINAMQRHKARVIIADFNDDRVSAAFPRVYTLIYLGVRFFDAATVYEEVFGRIPLSVLNEQWLARNLSRYAHTLYDVLKRAVDIVIAVPAFLVSLIFYPFIALVLKIQDGGEIIIAMPRIGEGGRIFNLRKFRSMSGNDLGFYENGASKLHVTRVGKFLRVSRLDEIPQLWNVITGELSLIGPRPETPGLVELYGKEIPYYQVRHLVRPGLSGWAQLYGQHAHHGVGIVETRDKLSYDLYYIKHRSLVLDITIALKTIKKLLTRSGV